MKVCPVCSESFADELKFCDLDGTKLKREPGSQPSSSQGRVWSLLGVGVFLGALVIATLSVIFTPKPNLAPTIASSVAPSSAVQNPAGSTSASAAETQPIPATDQPQTMAEVIPPPATKKKEKALDDENSNTSLPAISPKDAARSTEEAAKETPRVEEAKSGPSTDPKKVETVSTVKPAADTGESENSPKAAATTAEAKKDKKATNTKESDSKKKEDEKKKGGFFRVFKKIFGKG